MYGDPGGQRWGHSFCASLRPLPLGVLTRRRGVARKPEELRSEVMTCLRRYGNACDVAMT